MTFPKRCLEIILWNKFALLFLMGTSKEGLALSCAFSSSLGLCLSAIPGTEVGTSHFFPFDHVIGPES